MKNGYLTDYFEIVIVKRLSAVEADVSRSNQHEFNGSKELKRIFGTETGEKRRFSTKFIWFGESNEGISEDGFVTWYDARLDHPTRSEYRLYFPTTDVSRLSTEGDSLFVAKRTDGKIMIIVASANSTVENQLMWLFGISMEVGRNFTLQDKEGLKHTEIDFTVRFIFDELGIEIEEPETDHLDQLLERFDFIFPPTKEFSYFARNTLSNVSPVDEPDKTLLAWIEQEEKLFRRLERHIVAKRIEDGFLSSDGTDVDGFISFSLSVQNRRKSRAGYALENHLEEIFSRHDIHHKRSALTENRAKPDFLFPGEAEYHDPEFPDTRLSMLGVKTTCKDRWRQVLSEAGRIKRKHLLTLEPGISENQTSEMKANQLQLVIPNDLKQTYTVNQQSEIIDLNQFIVLVRERQSMSL